MAGLHDRVERGLVIARTPGDIEWVTDSICSVKSQDGKGVYLVTFEGGRARCICPDFTAYNLPCKHILGIEFQRKGITPLEAREADASRPRPSYSQDWKSYNGAKRAEQTEFGRVLQDLVSDLTDPSPPKHTGRPRLPYRDIVYCAVERQFTGLPLRDAQGTYAASCEAGRISCIPSDNMPSLLFRRPETTGILTNLIAKSALALASVETTFAVDSSGFRTTSFGDYCRERYQARFHNVWKKLHIIVGTETGIIPAVVVTDGHAADIAQFPALVEAVAAAGFTVAEVSADKAYLSGENFTVVAKAGGIPYIMFKENSRGRSKHRDDHSPWWKKMWHLFQSDPTGYLAHYHKRSNVESTFAAIKKKFGETLRSRDPTAQVNELLSKVLVHNIQILIQASFERGIPLPGKASPKDAPETPEGVGLGKEPPAARAIPSVEPPTTWPGGNN
jgi:transposase